MPDAPEKLTTGDPLSSEELLEYLPALKEVPATLLKTWALGAAVRRRFAPGDIVCEEGEFGSTAFFLVSGHVEIFISNPLAHVRTKPRGIASFFKRMTSTLARRGDDASASDTAERGFIPIDASVDLPRNTPIAFLGAGELFGEMTCRTFQPRSATVRATEDCVMVEMLRVILDMLVGTRDVDATTKASTKVKAPTFKGTSFKKQMDDQYRERSLVAHLRSVPLFATLDLDFFNYLRDHAELVSCNKGQVICKQGDPADAFYLIRTGLVRVAQAMPGGEMVRTYLKKGEFFGEIGLLSDHARNATCSALDAVDLVKISKEDFQLMLEKFPIVRATVEAVARVRVAADQERKLPVGLQLDEFLNQGLFEAQNLLLIDLDHCTRCDACVNACADAHEGVTRLIRDGLRYDRYLVATACRSCRDPLCMTQCPVGSIRRKESLEIIIEDWCIGCGKCAELCPYGNINMHTFEVKKEVPATEPKPAAKPAPAAAKGAPAAAKGAPAAAKDTPAPAKDTPAPAKDTPALTKDTPALAKDTPAAAANAAKPAAATAPAATKPAPKPAPAATAEPATPAPEAVAKSAPAAPAPAVPLKDPALPAPEAARDTAGEAVPAATATTDPTAPKPPLSAFAPSPNEPSPAPTATPQPPTEAPQAPTAPPQEPIAERQSPTGPPQSPTVPIHSPAGAVPSPTASPQSPPDPSQSPTESMQSPNVPRQSPTGSPQSPPDKQQSSTASPQPLTESRPSSTRRDALLRVPDLSPQPPTESPQPPTAPAQTLPTQASPAPTAPAPSPAAKPAEKPKPSAPAPKAPAAAPKKMVKKKVSVSKATTCDLCTQLSVPSCVYACPHEAAMRVDPVKFLSQHIGARGAKAKRRFGWLLRKRDDRTTH